MAEKKPGFFGRLFGKKEAEKPEAQTEETTEKVEVQPVDAAVDSVEPSPAPPPDSNTVDATLVDQAISEPEASLGAHAAQAGPEESIEPPSQAAPASPAPLPESDAVDAMPVDQASLHPEESVSDASSNATGGNDKNGGGAGDGSSATGGGKKEKNWFQRLTSGLKKSSDQLTENIASVFTKRKLDDETLEQLEDVLIQADLGVDTAVEITEKLAQDRFNKEISVDEIREVLRDEVVKVLEPVAEPLVLDGSNTPHVILMVGVNGSGKTTTIGKLASKLTGEGKKVLLAAGDTFRAAAVEQLQVWGQRSNVEVITRPTGADASGLAYDAVTQAKETGADVLIIDTAGRLQNRDELMAELEKIIRVIKKIDENAPHTTLLTLDATTGQNALNQVEIFGKRAGVSGLVMTKLDGTARGGILVAIAKKHKLPVHFIGVGEGIDDLEPFKASEFAEAIAGGEAGLDG